MTDEKPNPLGTIHSPNTPPQEGSTLRLALARFEKTWLPLTFRNTVGSTWDQPAPLPSAAKYPETLRELKPALCTWDECVSLDIGESRTNRKPDSGIGAGVIADHMTAVQWSALLAWRAWPLGDRSALNLLQVAIRLAAGAVLRAPWASVRACGAYDELGNVGALSPLEKVHAWSLGRPREPAREWARELDALAAHAEEWAGLHSRADNAANAPHSLCDAAAVDVAASAYACALAFLLEDRDAFALNVYRMMRSAAGIACRAWRTFGRAGVPPEESIADAYQVNDRPMRNELLRAWPGVVACRPPGDARPFGPRIVPLKDRYVVPDGFWFGPPAPGGVLSRDMLTASRLRGWVPCLHPEIPAQAFEPYPNEKESEEP